MSARKEKKSSSFFANGRRIILKKNIYNIIQESFSSSLQSTVLIFFLLSAHLNPFYVHLMANNLQFLGNQVLSLIFFLASKKNLIFFFCSALYNGAISCTEEK
jgi:hypothetical protein